MGPVSFSLEFKPGTLVKISDLRKISHNRKKEMGTIIDNFVNFEIHSGKREEKALIMWSDSKMEWLSVHYLEVIQFE